MTVVISPCTSCVSYVALAVRLGKDEHYRRWAGELIDERSHVLWEQREVVIEWARFLSRAAGRLPPIADEVCVMTNFGWEVLVPI